MGVPLDPLTPREREVLALLRHGLTNEEIAQRLGISLDGAKYHVSQILSKLGVATREEAAAVALGERRRWWAAWPVWGRIAGGATVAAALVGLVLLAWAVVRTGGPGDEPVPITGLTLEDAYGRVAEAMVRPGFVLHTTIVAASPPDTEGEPADPDELAPYFTTELWIDAPNETTRSDFRLDPSRDSYDIATEGTYIVIGEYVYVPDDPGEVLRHELETIGQSLCPGSSSAAVSLLLGCGGGLAGEALDETFTSRLESDRYDGPAAVVLVFEKSEQVPVAQEGGPVPPALSPTPTPLIPPETTEFRTVSRIYLDPGDFLPVARVTEYENEGTLLGRVLLEYKHEFVPLDELPGAFLDPRSIGYGAEGAGPLLDEIGREVPVYWLGEELEAQAGLCASSSSQCDLVLTRVLLEDSEIASQRCPDPCPGSGQLVYETPDGLEALSLHLFTAEEFERFRETDLGRVLYDAPCVQRSERDVPGGNAVIFHTHRPIFSGGPSGPIAGPLPYEIPETTPVSPPASAPPGLPALTPIPQRPSPPPTTAAGGTPLFTPPGQPTLASGCPAAAPNHFPAHVFFADAVVGVNIPLYLDHPIFFPEFDTSAAVEFVVDNLRRR